MPKNHTPTFMNILIALKPLLKLHSVISETKVDDYAVQQLKSITD